MLRADAAARSFLRGNPMLYKLALKFFWGWRQFSYAIRVFPLPIGRSPYDSLGKRGELRRLSEKAVMARNLDNNLDWSEDFERAGSIAAHQSDFFPISFSWPLMHPAESDLALVDRKLVSTIIPGEAYSFDDYSSYLSEYQDSKFAITIKKGGWDCFRHLEILASGAIPLMPDIGKCPEWAMSHYPKAAMMQVVDKFNRGEDLPIESWVNFQKWFERHLTSAAMAGFILRRVGYSSPRVIFLDPGLSTVPDYLSVMTYTGLKQQLGPTKVIAPLGSESVYSDWSGEATKLHGLGFGYTKLLDPSVRSDEETHAVGINEALKSIKDEDFVVVGNVSRNFELAHQVDSLRKNPRSVLFIWGDDRSPDRAQIRWLRSLSGFKAIREFYPSPALLL